MQPLSNFVSSQNEDPFVIIKNHRMKFQRPKAKYVRKAPYTKKIAKLIPSTF